MMTTTTGGSDLVRRARAELRRADRLRSEGRNAEAEQAMTAAGDLYDRAGYLETANAIFRGDNR